MPSPNLYNRIKFTTATTGTGTVTVGSAVAGFRTPATAGVPTGTTDIPYAIEDGVNWETGTGTYTAAGTLFSRILEDSSTGSLLDLSGSAVMYVTPTAATLHPTNAWVAVEKNLGYPAKRSGSFTVTGLSGLTVGKHVEARQLVAVTTNKPNADEYEMDVMSVEGIVTSTSIITFYYSCPNRVGGTFKFNYMVGK